LDEVQSFSELRLVQLIAPRPSNALRFCCEGVRRSRAGYSRIYLVRLRRAYALASSKRGLGGWPSTPGQNFEEATRSRSLIEVNTAGKHEVVDGVQN
jgi:hypothetical protein